MPAVARDIGVGARKRTQKKEQEMTTDGNGDTPNLTEPEPLPCLFVTGFQIQTDDAIVRLVFWADLPAMGNRPAEARLQARITMLEKTFRRLLSEGRRRHSRGN
ncbi:hypothetical protein NKH14_17445 [Mesorhizobium sp. M1380]|uniref:hypothetical protein n=1 Tax=Mesorhizobium sp. M1380 TaxID=2957093 RepID=UPI003336037B